MKTPILQIITDHDELRMLLVDIVREAIKSIPKEEIDPLDVIDGDELKRRIGVSETTLKRYRDQGRIPYVLIGSQYRYNYPDVIEALTVKNRRI